MKLKKIFIVSETFSKKLFIIIIILIILACRIVTIHLFNNNENISGECLVDLESENDVKDALKKTNTTIANRYVESKII